MTWLTALTALGCRADSGGDPPAGDGSTGFGEASSSGCVIDCTDGTGGMGESSGSSGEGEPGGESSGAEPDPLVRSVESGDLRGFEVDGAYAFFGVPFAAPPVGDLRWRPPEPPASWDGIREATELSARCIQPSGVVGENTEAPSLGDEDCLYLNVWEPADADPAESLPVMVFLHGGGNLAGSTADALDSLVFARDETAGAGMLYDGPRLAARGEVVVVTTNYRLGALGFMTHPALDAESDTGLSGNWGLMDQIATLQWVQSNIRAFGGDPDRVMLFGQSGGGRDVVLLATSPLTAGLFSAVAMHSAPLGAQDKAPAVDKAEELVAEMGCVDEPDVIACMREIEDAHRFVLADAATPEGLASGAFRPIVDGHVVTEQPRDVVSRPDNGVVPMLIGTTEDEYSHRWPDITPQTYEGWVTTMIGEYQGNAALEQYPLERFGGDAVVAFGTLMSDRNVTCTIRRFSRLAAEGNTPVYQYRFAELLVEPARHGYGVYHTTDLLYLFQHMDGVAFDADEGDRAAAASVMRYWTRFAASGDPNGGGDVLWPPFSLESEPYLRLQAETQAAERLKEADCDFWQGLQSPG